MATDRAAPHGSPSSSTSSPVIQQPQFRPVHPEDWLNRKDAANFLTAFGYPTTWRVLEKLASNNNAGGGPPYTQFRWSRVSYQVKDLIEWAQANSRRVK
jgi:hypothetical protein